MSALEQEATPATGQDRMQEVMTKAYERYTPEMTRQEFWDQLDATERAVVFVGNLNYQVCNGGWPQYADNGYAQAESLNYVLRLCHKMDTPASKTVAGIIEKFLPLWKDWKHAEEDRWSAHDTWPGFYENCEPLNEAFYDVNEQWMEDVAVHVLPDTETR